MSINLRSILFWTQNSLLVENVPPLEELQSIGYHIKNEFQIVLNKLENELDIGYANLEVEIANSIDWSCSIGDSKICISPLFLISNILPEHLRPLDSTDSRLDNIEYWQNLNKWICKVFSLEPHNETEIDIAVSKKNLLLTLSNKNFVREVVLEFIKPHLKNYIYYKKLCDIILPIMKDTNLENMNEIAIQYSYPIDPTMASAGHRSINICPLFVLDFNKIPEHLRPNGSKDSRLYDLNFLQELSDWIARELGIEKQKVGVMEIAAIITILKLRENPTMFHTAFKAGVAHELGHIVHNHSHKMRQYRPLALESAIRWGRILGVSTWFTAVASSFFLKLPVMNLKWGALTTVTMGFLVNAGAKSAIYHAKLANHIKIGEREADLHAVRHLKNEGVEGIRIGFSAWQEAIKEVRLSKHLKAKDKILFKALTTSKGNVVPLLVTHGSFEDRLHRAEQAL